MKRLIRFFKKLFGKKNLLKIFIPIRLFLDSIYRFSLLSIEYNDYNGFIFSVAGVEYLGENRDFEGELFGIHIAKRHLIICILFIMFDIKSPFSPSSK